MSVDFSKRLEAHVTNCLQCWPDYASLSLEEESVAVQLYKKKCYEHAMQKAGPSALLTFVTKKIEEFSTGQQIPEEQRTKCEQIAAHVFSSH